MEELKAKAWLIVAALGGSFIGQYISDEPLNNKQRLGFIIAGVCTALFLIPWALEYFGVSGTTAASGLSFIAGVYWKKVIVKAGELVDLVKLPSGVKKSDE